MTAQPLLDARDRSWAFDIALCAAVGFISLVPMLASGASPLSTGLAMLIIVPLLVRRTMPALALAAMFLAALGYVLVAAQPTLAIVAVPILIYSVARFGSLSLARLGLAAGLVGSALGPGRWTLDDGLDRSSGALLVVTAAACAGIVSAAYLVGRRRREGVENAEARTRSAAERERLLLVDQEQRARMATTAERNRIARELHDIVAHSLSVIVVQAEGGRALATRHPERAPEVLTTIAETSREALEEMRRMVGLLRSEPGEHQPTDYRPTPGLDDIPELVRKTSDTAELSMFGSAPPVSPALGLTAYRLVQESLTNVLKHAGPVATARITVAYTATSIELEIVDDGRGAAANPDHSQPAVVEPGHGLQGMYERVALHGGELTAHPRPGGGFVVRASLPLHQDATLPLDVQPAGS